MYNLQQTALCKVIDVLGGKALMCMCIDDSHLHPLQFQVRGSTAQHRQRGPPLFDSQLPGIGDGVSVCNRHGFLASCNALVLC